MNKITLLTSFILTSLMFFGQNCQFVKSFGGSHGNDIGISCAVDNLGNIYSTGIFYDTTDFDPGIGINILTASNYGDIYISKLSPNGNFIWAKSIKGPAPGIGSGAYFVFSIGLDAYSNPVIVGQFRGTIDFDPGPGVYAISSNTATPNSDAFVLKLDNNGNFLWAINFGGHGTGNTCGAKAIDTDKNNNIYVTGGFGGIIDFDPGIGNLFLNSAVTGGFYISKLDQYANLIYVKCLNNLYVSSIITDSKKNIYLTGNFNGNTDFDPSIGNYYLNSANGPLFLLKLDSLGNFVFARNFGELNSHSNSLSVDSLGNILLTGDYALTGDFDPSPATNNITAIGSQDAFILKLDSTGNFIWVKSIGDFGTDYGHSITVDKYANVIITGTMDGTVDIDPGASTYTVSTWSNGLYLVKLNGNGNFVWGKGIQASSRFSKTLATFGSDIILIGEFATTKDFDPPNNISATSNGNTDVFIAKYSSLTDINEFNFHNSITHYPNPTINNLTIKHQNQFLNSDAIIELINSKGEIVLKIPFNEQVDLSELKSGIYFLLIHSSTNYQIFYKSKIIKINSIIE